MVRSKRLQPVQRLANQAAERQALVLQQAQKVAASAQDKLDQLCEYRLDYLARLRQREQGAIDLRHLQEGRVFLTKLTEAIAIQAQEVSRANQQLSKQRQELISLQQKCQSFDGLVDRYQVMERHEADRLDQLRADDLASQQFVWRQRQPV
jgi:flagellar FliJ protein